MAKGKTKIDWADYSWNPVTGCLHGCLYCYASKIANRYRDRDFDQYRGQYSECATFVLEEPKFRFLKGSFDSVKSPYPYGFSPTFHRYRLDEPSRKTKPSQKDINARIEKGWNTANLNDPLKIFVGSMADLFGEWVPDEWIREVFKACEAVPQHRYLFLTKNPYRYLQLHIQEKLPKNSNFWYGTTLTGQGNLPFNCLDFKRNFISVEPLLGNVSNKFPFTNINWVIVGAQTGPGAVKPKPEWVQGIIDQARAANVPIFLKDNLNWQEKIREFPKHWRD